jgi:hypothetical protein
MHALNRRLRKGRDSLAVKQGLDAYLNKMPLPKITDSVGETCNAMQTAPTKKAGAKTAASMTSEQKVAGKTNGATKSTESAGPLLNAKVSFSTLPPRPVVAPIASVTPKPVQPTRIKAPTGLGSGIQSTSSSSKAPELREPPNEKEAFAKADDESNSFLQTMQISRSEPATDPFSKTIPQLRN